MKTNVFILVFLVVMLSFSEKGMAEIKLKNLRTTINENLSSSVKITPSFSWQMQLGQRNQLQTAYQIQVAANSEDLKSSKGLVWDSGQLNFSQSVLVSYKGKELKPASTYYWKVKVWNQDNEPSAWSETASFHTGLLSDSDWAGARWIGYRDLLPELRVVPGIHGYGDKMEQLGLLRPVVPLLRKEFEASGGIESVILFISGLGQYEAFINGKKVGNSFLAPGWTNYDKTVFTLW